jgi:hypothetical protein
MEYVKAHFTISDGVYGFTTLIIVKGKAKGCTGFCSFLPPSPPQSPQKNKIKI